MILLPNRKRLVDNFNCCLDWNERYQYIIELGSFLPRYPDFLHKRDNIVPGCQSRTWISLNQTSSKKIIFDGDSDSSIVKGLIVVIFIILDNIPIQDLVLFDIKPWLERLSLTRYLSISRSNGIKSILKTIRCRATIIIENEINN